MRKVVFIFFTFMIFTIPSLSAQKADVKEQDSGEVTPEEKQRLTSQDLSIVKSTEQHIEKASQAIASAKDELAQEKMNLTLRAAQPSTQRPPLNAEEKGDIVRENLETIEKKEAAIKVAESFFEFKSTAYQQITELIEKKLELLDDRTLAASLFEKEVVKTFEELERLEVLDEKNQAAIKRNQQETKSLKKHIETKQLLINLKGGEDKALVPTLRGIQERLEAAKIQQKYLEEKAKIILLQKEVVGNYNKILAEERWDRLRSELFSPKETSFSLGEMVSLIGTFLFFLLLTFKRKSITSFLKEESRFGSKKVGFLFTPFLIFNWTLLISYLILSVIGFHSLTRYFGEKIVLIWSLGFVLILLFKIPKGLAKVFLFHASKRASEEEKEQEKVQHPYFGLIFTVMAWAVFGVFIYFTMKVLGIYHDGITFIRKGLFYPFFKIGDVGLSLQLILKAGIIVWFFVFSARVISNILSKTIYTKMRFDENTQYTVSVAIKYFMLIAGCFIGLNVLGVKMTALTVFAGTVGIGIGFGLQDIAKNFISGLVMLVERPIKIGDYIEVGGLPGKVRAILARSTIVDTFDNISVVVPNSEFMSQQVINWSHSDRIMRVKIPVGVAYGSDVELVNKILLEVAEKHPNVISYKKPSVWFEEFGDSSLNFTLLVWTNNPEDRFKLKSEINMAIDTEFRKNKVTIPFPQRDLHFKSSDIPANLNQEALRKDADKPKESS